MKIMKKKPIIVIQDISSKCFFARPNRLDTLRHAKVFGSFEAASAARARLNGLVAAARSAGRKSKKMYVVRVVSHERFFNANANTILPSRRVA